MTAILLFLKGIPMWLWVGLALLAGGLFYGHMRYQAGQAEIQKQWDAAIERGQKIARATEETWRGKVYDLAFQAEKKRLARERETERTIAGIRSGSVRLRERFTCPRLPGTATSAHSAENGGLRTEDAEFLVRIGDEADGVTDDLNQCIASYNALKLQ